MSLPKNIEELADGCPGIEPARRQQIVDHLKAMSPVNQDATVKQMIATGGDGARLIEHILGKDQPGAKDAPANKKVNPLQSK